mmetsp:Transcript_61358/g.181400  ORF Transcript_61358/g.181400 Transcript_61358/m.181400 type:complete len:231 (+) Transcript_61358:920-1612(+)
MMVTPQQYCQHPVLPSKSPLLLSESYASPQLLADQTESSRADCREEQLTASLHSGVSPSACFDSGSTMPFPESCPSFWLGLLSFACCHCRFLSRCSPMIKMTYFGKTEVAQSQYPLNSHHPQILPRYQLHRKAHSAPLCSALYSGVLAALPIHFYSHLHLSHEFLDLWSTFGPHSGLGSPPRQLLLHSLAQFGTVVAAVPNGPQWVRSPSVYERRCFVHFHLKAHCCRCL